MSKTINCYDCGILLENVGNNTKRCKPCAKEAVRLSQAKYFQSEKGKAAQAKALAKYFKTEKGKAALAKALAKYFKTEKGKAMKAKNDVKYRKSDNGKATRKAAAHNRRARIKGNGGTLTTKQIQELQATPDKSCFWCEVDCNDKYELDHIVPINKGGRNSLCNTAISCPTCNRSKGDKDLSEWLNQIKWFK